MSRDKGPQTVSVRIYLKTKDRWDAERGDKTLADYAEDFSQPLDAETFKATQYGISRLAVGESIEIPINTGAPSLPNGVEYDEVKNHLAYLKDRRTMAFSMEWGNGIKHPNPSLNNVKLISVILTRTL